MCTKFQFYYSIRAITIFILEIQHTYYTVCGKMVPGKMVSEKWSPGKIVPEKNGPREKLSPRKMVPGKMSFKNCSPLKEC